MRNFNNICHINNKEYKLYRIMISDDFISLGYIRENNLWNGWECPIFNEQQIEEQIEKFNNEEGYEDYFDCLEEIFEYGGIKYYEFSGYTFDKE